MKWDTSNFEGPLDLNRGTIFFIWIWTNFETIGSLSEGIFENGTLWTLESCQNEINMTVTTSHKFKDHWQVCSYLGFSNYADKMSKG